ncbi:MAG: pyridoxamine 5'-phosphate oxidase family protein [Propionibacteriales bacterium]|nr:pyridoxamine 5'-phosphate oxidase family protein [Propionibacteriales bacterium]
MSSYGLSPTDRTTIRRLSDRARTDRAELFDLLDSAVICHLGMILDGRPLVLPTVFAPDPDGPDKGGTVYLHGSVAARSLVEAPDQDVCVTWTQVDGLVLARSGFHHSMNYRSAVAIGRGRLVVDPQEKRRALDLVVDHVVPGRSATLRGHHRKELAATSVIAVALHEASLKQRTGDPVDDSDDIATGRWAGVLPLKVTTGEIVTAGDAQGVPVPSDVRRLAQTWR